MAEKDGVVLTVDERKTVVKALELLASSRGRQLAKEDSGSSISELLKQDIGQIENLALRFR